MMMSPQLISALSAPVPPTRIKTFAPSSINSTTAISVDGAPIPVEQIVTGYIICTSAAATTITLPTGTLLGAALNATKGTVFDLFIDNTGGANTVTVAVATNGIKLALGVAEAGGAGFLTVPLGVTGLAQFRLMFASATAYAFTRVA